MITADYGSWGQKIKHESITLDSAAADALNGEYTDAEELAIISAYRDAINAALPDSVELCGNQFYGPHNPAAGEFDAYPKDEHGDLDLDAIVHSVDFWAIVERVTA